MRIAQVGLRGTWDAPHDIWKTLRDSRKCLRMPQKLCRVCGCPGKMIHGLALKGILEPCEEEGKGIKACDDGSKPVQFGLIAEEVAETFPELAVLNDKGQPETVKYQDLAPMLLNEFQKEHKRVAELQNKVTALEKRLADLDSKDRERENRLTKLEQSLHAGQPAAIPAKLETASR